MHRIILATGLVLCAVSATAQQPAVVLTYEEALARARSGAPAIVAARMRIEEARGRAIGAALPFSSNPTLSVEGGRRSSVTSSNDYSFELGQELDLPARKRARRDGARAGVSTEEQRARESARQLLRDVAISYLRALEARERLGVAAAAKRLAEEAQTIAQRRYAAGDVAKLDLNLARTAVARADAETHTATATFTAQTTTLQVLLGITAPLTIDGSLRDLPALSTSDLLARALEGADLRTLDAEIAEAEADQRLARTLRWPDVGLRASYSREGDERVVLGGLGISIPLFQRGQEASAVAAARTTRLRLEREALARTVEAEVKGAVTALEALRNAVAEVQSSVLPLVEENERLAIESYDVGQIGLAELLLVRRDALDARGAFIDQLIAMRLVEIELTARAEAWPGASK